jgi:hypothetical protein
MTDDPHQDNQPPVAYPAEKARQGRIILRHKASRIVFIAGFVLIGVLILWAWWS